MRIFFALLSLFLAHSTIAQENIFLHPDRERWTNDVFVLFDHTFLSKSAVLSAYKEGRRTDIPALELQDNDIERAYGLLPELSTGRLTNDESARTKLGRYLILRTKSIAASERIARSLATRPDVLYSSVSTSAKPSASCPSGSSDPPLVQVSESKTWGFSIVRASSAWNYARGHSYIGMADFGSDPNHDDLKPFSGNNYIKGLFTESCG